MREHIRYNWPLYAVLIGIAILVGLLGVVFAEKQRRAEICLDRGMLVVETAAGARCAAPASMERIR